MAVTLEFVQLLIYEHDMDGAETQKVRGKARLDKFFSPLFFFHSSPFPLSLPVQALDLLRQHGTRIENVFKNIGDRRYAFNLLQVRTLPRLLRPPDGTFGASVA